MFWKFDEEEKKCFHSLYLDFIGPILFSVILPKGSNCSQYLWLQMEYRRLRLILDTSNSSMLFQDTSMLVQLLLLRLDGHVKVAGL